MNNKKEIIELINQAYIGIQNLQIQSSRQNVMIMSSVYSSLEKAVKLIGASQTEPVSTKADK